MNSEILQQTEKYYTEKIRAFGASNLGVDWNSIESQVLRFEQLSKIFEREENESEFSLCDYGCGYGYYTEFLFHRRPFSKYTGIDLSYDMIQTAKQKYKEHLEEITFINSSNIEGNYDYIIASGIFNVRQDVKNEDWKSYMTEVLSSFDRHSIKGFAFNCLTKYSDEDHMKDYLYYADPLFWFDYFKKNVSRNVALLHDYGLYEFTILVRK